MVNRQENNKTNYSEEQVLGIIEDLRQESWRSEMCYGALGIIKLHRGWDEFQNLTSVQKLNIARKIFYYYEKYRSNDKRFSGIVLDAIMNPELSEKQKRDLWDINPGGMSIARAIKIADERNLRIQRDLQNKIQEDSKIAFHEIYRFNDGNFRIVKIDGTREERENAFKKITLDMGNCLGGTHLQEYLNNTEGSGRSEIYIMLADRDIFDEQTGKKLYEEGQSVVAFELYRSVNEFHQIEGSKKVTYGKMSKNGILEKNVMIFLREITEGKIKQFDSKTIVEKGVLDTIFI